MADTSSFSLGDIGSALGSLIKDTGGVFRDQVLQAGQNKAVAYSQKIIVGLSKATQSTSNMLGLSHPSELAANKKDDAGTQAQVSAFKLFGYNLTQTQLILVAALGGVFLVGILSWMRTRS